MDLPGFDATEPLAVANLPAYRWAAIYLHGRYAARVLPATEQAQLPAALGLLPLSVISWDSPSGPILAGSSAGEGQADAADYLRALEARGWVTGQAVSTDYESGVETLPGFSAYANAHGAVIRQAGYLHYPYARSTALDLLSEKDGVWLTDWSGDTADDGLSTYWRAQGPFARQWGGTVQNADLDLCDGRFYAALRGAMVDSATSKPFSTGFGIGGGFYQFWLHSGGLAAFGMPISQEYDTTGADGQPVRRQWFERAVFEWRPGQYPAQWDTLPVLLGDLVRSQQTAALAADALAHNEAFTHA